MAENSGIASKIPLVRWIYCLSQLPIAAACRHQILQSATIVVKRSWCRSVGSRQMTLFRGCYVMSPLSNVRFSFSSMEQCAILSLIPRLARNTNSYSSSSSSSSYHLLGKSFTCSPLITTSAYRFFSRYQCDTGDQMEPIINSISLLLATKHATCLASALT